MTREELEAVATSSTTEEVTDPTSDQSSKPTPNQVTVKDEPLTEQPTLNLKKIAKTDAEWKAQLSREQFYVTREEGTERAFSGTYWNNKKKGIYNCVCCDLPLFDSSTKYESGTGWPSFWQPIDKRHVSEHEDRKLFSVRTEVRCWRCDAHLGHVFSDGPDPTGLRYCMNSAALKFQESQSADPPNQPGESSSEPPSKAK